LLTPLLEELGTRWEKNEGSVAEEHFFSFYLRNKLGARFHHLVKSSGGPTLLLSCLPGDQHETGLLIFALTANAAGYDTIALGADLPLQELPAVVAKTGCKAIVLSGVMQPSPALLNKTLPELASAVDVPVFLGGNASIKAHDAIKRAGAQPLGTDMKSALARIREIIPLP
jgi:cobalamin-dependent methionine synthase I